MVFPIFSVSSTTKVLSSPENSSKELEHEAILDSSLEPPEIVSVATIKPEPENPPEPDYECETVPLTYEEQTLSIDNFKDQGSVRDQIFNPSGDPLIVPKLEVFEVTFDNS